MSSQDQHDAFMTMCEKPIEPGLALALVECERLWNEDRPNYHVLIDWLIKKLGRTVHGVYIAACYSTDEYINDGFKVPESFLQVIKKKE